MDDVPIVHNPDEVMNDIEIVSDVYRIGELFSAIGDDPSVGIDIETNALRPYNDGRILSFGFSTRSHTFSFGLDHPDCRWSDLERKQILKLVKEFLLHAKGRKIVHHLPFELEWFGYYFGGGIFHAGRWDDSESQAYLLDPRRGGLSLDFLCVQNFGLNLKAISGLDRKNLDKVPLKQVLSYNGLDARYHRLLWIAQNKKIKDGGLKDLYEHQLGRIAPLVLEQLHGVPVDQHVVDDLRSKYKSRIEEATKEIAEDEAVAEFEEIKRAKFNPGSPRDVNYLFQRILNVDIQTTQKGELSNVDHPIANKIIKFREANKVLSTYIEPSADVFADGLLHPIISSTTVVTARTSSDSPNIQNFPKRDDERKEVRSVVKSRDVDMRVVSIDYAGIQARNVAMESRDKRLVDAFWTGYDIHSDWRDRIAKIYPRWIPKEKRDDKDAMKAFRHLAKNKFVFPTFFGAQSFNTSEGLGIPKEICERLREEFFSEFRDIARWHKALDRHYYKHGYVTGLSGYRRYAPVSANERINSPIQADEATIVLDAMRRLADLEDPRYQPMLMVHDDITWLMPAKDIDKRLSVILPLLVNCPFEWTKIVPLEVEVSVGTDWLNVAPVGSYRTGNNGTVVEAG
jgi:DNA polymerase I-like protein with 3'-5' exonuclease and polymerase domains